MVDTSIVFDLIARDKASRTILGVGKSADSTKSKLMGMAVKGAAAFAVVGTAAAVFAYKVGSDYVGSLNKIQALTGANDATMKKAAETLEGNSTLYAKMGQTTGDAAAGVVELTKAGLSLHDSLKAVNATMVLAKAGEMSVADASTLVANSLNTFGLKAKSAGKIANQLANAANISSADVSDLAESFKYVAPIAAASGVSMAQVNAILAELSNSGIKASNAGTGLRKFLLSLQSPSGAAATDLANLNVQIFDASGKMKPLGTVIGDLASHMRGLSDEAKSKDLKDIFGLQGMASAQVILKNNVKGLDDYTKGVNKAGAATRLAQANSKGLAGTLSMFKAETISTAQSLYRQWSPAVNSALLWLVKLSGEIRQGVIPQIQHFANIVQSKVPELVKFASKIRDNLTPALQNMKSELKKDRPAVMNLLGAFQETIPKIARLTGHLSDLSTQMTGHSSPAWARFIRILGGAGLRYIGNWIRTAGQLADGLDGLASQAASVTHGIMNLGGAFKTAGNKAASFAGSIGGRISSAVGNLGSVLYSAGQEVISGLISGITSKLGALGSTLGGVGSFIKAHKGPPEYDRVMLTPAGVAIMEGLIDGIHKGEKPLKAALDKVTGYISAQRDKLNSLLSAKAGFAQGFQSFTESVFSTDLSKTSTDAQGNDVTTPASISDMLAYQKQQRDKARQLRADVARLHKLGLSNSLIKQLQASGESGIEQIHALAGGSRADIAQANALDKQTHKALGRAGRTAAGQLYDKQIVQVRNNEDLAKRIARELHKLQQGVGKDEYAVITLNDREIIRAIKKTNRHHGKKSANV